MYNLSTIMADLLNDLWVVSPCCGRVQSANDVTQKVEKTLNNTNTTTQKRITMVSATPRKTRFI